MDKDDRKWGMLLHFSVFAGYILPLAGLIAPILIWQLKKNDSPVMDAHGKNAVNFLISMFLYGFIAVLLSFVLIGIPILFVLAVIGVVFPIMAGIKANNGEVWKYPLMLEIIK